jgi:hypothetical protein
MEVSYDQAVEIYAKMMVFRWGDQATEKAEEEAQLRSRRGDTEGRDVWRRVARVAETLPRHPPREGGLNS